MASLQPHETLGKISRLPIRRRAVNVAHEIIYLTEPGGAHVPDGRHLNRRGTVSERRKARPLGMARKVHQDVHMIPINAAGRLLRGQALQITPVHRTPPETLGDVVRRTRHIAKHVEIELRKVPKERRQEIRHRMLPKIRRDVTDPHFPVRDRRRARVRHRDLRTEKAVDPFPDGPILLSLRTII